METEVLYWPPNPNPESFKEDTPNEGLMLTKWEFDESITISDFHADYQGTFLWNNTEEMGWDTSENETYQKAIELLKARFPLAESEEAKNLSWEAAVTWFRLTLESLGWVEMVFDENDEMYWRKK
jgi:hypothetical protein